MPANRSRTERWRDCLDQIKERGGGIEISVDRTAESSRKGSDLVLRVRIFDVTTNSIIVERPTAAGQPLSFAAGTPLIGVMSIGQNRWMFRTKIVNDNLRLPQAAMALQMPETVERCRRRDFYRVSTVELSLPKVTCWPLLDPTSIVAAEVANKAMILDMESGRVSPETQPRELVLPEVAPPYTAHLINLGGGGVGLLVDKSETSAVDRSKLIWMRVDLTPTIPAPLGITVRIAHTHLDSEQNVYIGGAFDFSFHTAHRDFVVSQIMRYAMLIQHGDSLAA
ncbi:MAG: flagellar brake domain-containing protein [Phycisphaerales bacterium]|nr:MAG: flagellar brake domain-containing protein [Phycisphaerales bacterium]